MGEKESIQKVNNFFTTFANAFKGIDGKKVGENVDFIEAELAKDDRGAWINHAVEQYLKKEELDDIPEELGIRIEDILDEIANREIKKFWGNIK
jgi:hypothetical protein